MKRITLIFTFVLSSLLSAHAFDNRSRWITASEGEVNKANTWIAFRRDITLHSVPEQVRTEIAADSKYIAFVEVKTREKDSLIKASDAVDYNKRKRIIATAQFYLSKNPSSLQPRFDVAEVYLDGYRADKFNYIKNAYTAENF